jgi:uncharacterized repeat protein (TIGR01451 family)
VTRPNATLKRAVVGVVAIAAFALAASVAWAIGTLDQTNTATGTGISTHGTQTFTAGLTGELDTVQLGVCRQQAFEGDLTVSIVGTHQDALNNLWIPDESNVLATQTVPGSSLSALTCGNFADSSTVTIPFDTPASVQTGTHYALVFDGENALIWTLTDDTYSGGTFCSGTNCTIFSADARFATFVTTPPPPPSADVAVSISGPASAKKGAQVSYLITVSNAGPDTAHNVVLTNPIPSGATFLGVSTSKGACTPPKKGGPITCALGDLTVGGGSSNSVSVKVSAKAGSNVLNIVSANSTANGAGSATADPQSSNNSASLSTAVTK